MSTTTISTTSSGSSNPMLSSGEATVIRVHQSHDETGSSRGSTSAEDPALQNSNNVDKKDQSNTSSSSSETPNSTAIPPMILDLLNNLYIGLTYYDRLAAEGDSLDLGYMSGIFKDLLEVEASSLVEDKVEEGDNDREERREAYDPQLKIAKLAASYVAAATERQRPLLVLQEELAKKLTYVNRLVKERTEVMRSRQERIKAKITADQAKLKLKEGDQQEENKEEEEMEDEEEGGGGKSA